MLTHDQLVSQLKDRPGVRQEVERIENEEGALLDLLLKARHEAGLTQAQVAERMGTQPPAVARLEGATAPQIPWAAIVSMRNRLIHGYFDINTTVVWRTATVEVPALVPLLKELAGPAEQAAG
ncbi:MAG TPA: hypothetical protein DD490_02585 [Acidobacteria bacterium]|nr:hypothetical protein [Acidobacteriota bacterium]